MCTENTFADLFCVEVLKRNSFSEFSVYICTVLSIEYVDFIHVFLLYLQKRNDGQNLVPKMGIYLHIRYLRIYAHAESWTFCGIYAEFIYMNERSYEKHIGYAEHPMSEFLRPYAEKIRTPIRYLRTYAHDRFWNFCG